MAERFQPILSEIDTSASSTRTSAAESIGVALQGGVALAGVVLEGRKLTQKADFSAQIQDIQQQAEAGKIEFSQAQEQLRLAEEGQNQQQLSSAKKRIDTFLRGEQQGKLTPTQVQTKVTSLFREFVSKNPSLETDLRKMISSSGLRSFAAATSDNSQADIQKQIMETANEMNVSPSVAYDTIVELSRSNTAVKLAENKLKLIDINKQEAVRGFNTLLTETTNTMINGGVDREGRPVPPIYEQFRNSLASATTDQDRFAIVDSYKNNLDLMKTQIRQIASQYAGRVGSEEANRVRDRELQRIDEMKNIIDSESIEKTNERLKTVNSLVKERGVQYVNRAFDNMGSVGRILQGMNERDKFTFSFQTAPRVLALAENFSEPELESMATSSDVQQASDANFALNLKRSGDAGQLTLIMKQLQSISIADTVSPTFSRELVAGVIEDSDEVTNTVKTMVNRRVEDGSLIKTGERAKLANSPEMQDQWINSANANAPVLFLNDVQNVLNNVLNKDVTIEVNFPVDGYVEPKTFLGARALGQQSKDIVKVSYIKDSGADLSSVSVGGRGAAGLTVAPQKVSNTLKKLDNTIANLSTFMSKEQIVEYLKGHLEGIDGLTLVIDGEAVQIGGENG